MARRRKGRPVHGWLVVDKPAGVTSTAVVGKVRRALDAAKAGHAGTLDPAATGVLAVALGEATKTVPFVTEAMKGYRFTIRLGAATDTDDAEGRVIETADLRPTDAQIVAALGAFRGQIMQVPPQFSAVKVEGARAYDIAREGEAMALAARPLLVDRLEMVARPDAETVELDMICGKGGYVRSIARDLGRALGCLAHVLALRRVWSGPFHADVGLTLDAVTQMSAAELEARLLPLTVALDDLPQAALSAAGAARVRNGNPGEVTHSTAEFGDICWASHGGAPVAVGRYLGGMFHPDRVFN
ncbi:MAG: tRNA pseudouridine(55) synthase TruB, partial [Pararhodobacter sp.]|nr:tRNA pseudouridine(55) synthase TruB [Pararhodobacter sp.]